MTSKCIEASSRSSGRRRLKKYFGELQKGVLMCHKCDNHLCYNPDHVYLGDHSTNAIDKVARRGGNKLTPMQPWCIRYLRKRGYTLETIGNTFGITPQAVARVVRNG